MDDWLINFIFQVISLGIILRTMKFNYIIRIIVLLSEVLLVFCSCKLHFDRGLSRRDVIRECMFLESADDSICFPLPPGGCGGA